MKKKIKYKKKIYYLWMIEKGNQKYKTICKKIPLINFPQIKKY